jgi:glutathione S-transferase
LAGLHPGSDLELREVDLKAKPPELLRASSKGTVPVLVLPSGECDPGARVLAESLEIMRWARSYQTSTQAPGIVCEALIAENDGPFKHHLDRFRYGSRTPGEDPAWHRGEAMAILRRWNVHLEPGAGCWGIAPHSRTRLCSHSCASSGLRTPPDSTPNLILRRCRTG